MYQPVRYKLAQPMVPGNLRRDLLQMVLRLAPMATRTFRPPREHAVFCCHYSSVQFYFVAAREVLSDTGVEWGRVFTFAVLPRGQGDAGPGITILSILKVCVDGSPIFLASIGTRIKFLRDGSSYRFFTARCSPTLRV